MRERIKEPIGMNLPAPRQSIGGMAPPPSPPSPAPGPAFNRGMLGNVVNTPGFGGGGMTKTGTMPGAPGVEQKNAPKNVDLKPFVDELTAPPATPDIPEVNEAMNSALQQWMGNLENAYKSRVDDINQDTLAHMRGAANMAANAGLSFGGSFADAQRQVFMSGQRAQNEAYQNYMNQLGQPLSMQASQEFQTDWRDNERAYNEEQMAGQIGADLADEIGETIAAWQQQNPGRETPFTNAAGTQIPLEYLEPGLRGLIKEAAGAAGQDPEQWYAENWQDLGPTALQSSPAFEPADVRAHDNWDELMRETEEGDFRDGRPDDEYFKYLERIAENFGVEPQDLAESMGLQTFGRYN